LSSITEPRSERGQIIVIFAASLIVIFGVAALVFDGGMMLLEKRTQQNAADAAAIAGARFLPTNPTEAEDAAFALATENGFTDGVDNQVVDVYIPPVNGPHAGDDGFIEVIIRSERASFFSGIWGIFSHDVGSRAVAANQTGVLGPFAMLSLNPDSCNAMDVGGSGEIISNGDIQVNSTCPSGAMHLHGTGEIVTAPDVACNVVGGFNAGGGATYNCPVNEGVVPIPDPFLTLPEPPIPVDGGGAIVYPTAPLYISGSPSTIPSGCPGGSAAATQAVPAPCQFTGSYSGTVWRLFPGYYPGGIQLQAGTFYLEPGIYYMGGGGFIMNGSDVSITSVEAGGTTLGGGVLLFNGDNLPFANGPIQLNGGGSGSHLYPLDQGTQWDGIVVFQDRLVCEGALFNGAGTTLEVRGLIYIPCGLTTANGNGGTIIVDQIIADTFKLTGSGGSLTVAFDEDFLPGLTIAGLIE
jgi:hypothetical protein